MCRDGLAEIIMEGLIRSKTIEKLCVEAAQYAIETIDIEKCLVAKLARDTERAETQLCTGFDVDIEYTAKKEALQIVANNLLANKDFARSIESAVYEILSRQRINGKSRLDVELEHDGRISNADR